MERNEEKIRFVVDTNILISALLKDDSFTAKLLKLETFEIFYPEDGLREIEHYKDYIFSKRKNSLQKRSFEYALNFILDNVHIIPSELYSDKIVEAYNIMKEIDEKDTPFLALALALNCPIWSNDKHFRDQKKVEVFTTSKIIELVKKKL